MWHSAELGLVVISLLSWFTDVSTDVRVKWRILKLSH